MSCFITCEPPSKVPAQPSTANFHKSGPRRCRKSVTIPWLPGGRNSVKLRMVSRRAVLLPSQLEANATASKSVGKKARKRLNAMAWEITPHRGKTRATTRYIRFVKVSLAPFLLHYIEFLRWYYWRRARRALATPSSPVVHFSCALHTRLPEMKTAPAERSKPSGMGFKKSLLETYSINEMANQNLRSSTYWEWGALWRDCDFTR